MSLKLHPAKCRICEKDIDVAYMQMWNPNDNECMRFCAEKCLKRYWEVWEDKQKLLKTSSPIKHKKIVVL